MRTEKENWKLTLILWTALCTGCMAVMLLFASNKTIVITDGYQEQTELSADVSSGEHGLREMELILKPSDGAMGKFSVPLPENVRAEDVVVENRYMDRELWIYVKSGTIAFYEDNVISGDTAFIESACGEVREDGILLRLQMNHVREYESTMERDVLTFVCRKPEDIYDFIVVLDPEGGGSDTGCCGLELMEKDLNLQIARLVQKHLTAPEVRLYLTRTEDVYVSEQDRIQFVEEVNADIYIGLGAEFDAENPGNYGILSRYNEEYFIPGFGNVNLADLMTKQVTIAASNRAAGLFAAEEGSILNHLQTRGVQTSLGYLSNTKEETLLAQETYQEKLAEGIVKAVTEACDILRGLKNE